jgi:transposase
VCSTTIPRPNGKVRNGTRKFSSSEESTYQNQGQNNTCFFLTAVALCTKNLHLHALYKDVLERFRKRVRRVRRGIADDWVLHHENAPAHTGLSIREFLAKKNIPVLPHPPYSPDLALCDFYLFPKLKSKLKGHHFGTMEKAQKL